MFYPGDIIELNITDMDENGRGVGRADGMAVFAAGAVFGDMVKACVTEKRKNFALAETVEIVRRSESRARESTCPVSDVCGGCGLAVLSYEAELSLKERHVREKLSRIGGTDGPVRPIVGMREDEPLAYRNKGTVTVSPDGIGFLQKKSHSVVPIEDCPIQAPPLGAAVRALSAFMKETGVPAYDERDGSGLIRSMTVKTAFATGEVMAVLELCGSGLPHAGKLAAVLSEEIGESGPYRLASFVLAQSGVVKTAKSARKSARNGAGKDAVEVVSGRGYIVDRLLGLEFEISPYSFYQVNPFQTARLYEKALEYAGSGKSGDDAGKAFRGGRILDVYCGIGTIGLIAASRGAAKVLGVEYVEEAVEAARRNAEINGISGASFMSGPAERILPELSAAGENFDVVFLDPPRKGCAKGTLEAVAGTGAERIVYVSCDPATLARDVAILKALGYGFIEATPFDMFKKSMHVETVVLLSKVDKSTKKVYVDFPLEDMDMSGFVNGATYQEIKQYVKDNYNLTVSSLNIAQMKEKYGIKERENYNFSKKQNVKHPTCT